MRDMEKKKANDTRRHLERMKSDLDYRLKRVLTTIHARCKSGKGRKDWQYYGGLPVMLTVEELKIAWIRDGAANMRNPNVDRKENHLGYTFDNIQFLEHADNIKKTIPTRRPRAHPGGAVQVEALRELAKVIT